MIGRAIYHSPYFLAEIEKKIFKNYDVPSRSEVMENLMDHLEAGGKVSGNNIFQKTCVLGMQIFKKLIT